MPNTTETNYFPGTTQGKTKDGKPTQRIILYQVIRLVDEEGLEVDWKKEDIEIDCEKLWKLVKVVDDLVVKKGDK